MHAEEVDLGAHDLTPVQLHFDRDARDESEELLALTCAHADNPVRVATWRHQGPPKEGNGVIEAEHGIVIFDIILDKQVVHFFSHIIVIKIEVVPRVLWWQRIRRLRDIGDRSDLNRLVILISCQSDFVSGFGHRLAVPELMWLEQRNDIFQVRNAFILSILLHLRLDQLCCF